MDPVALYASDSSYPWGSGVMSKDAPSIETQVGNVTQCTSPCQLIALLSH